MITFKDILKVTAPLRNKIFLLAGRGIIKNVTTTKMTPLIQIQALKNENITDCQFLSPYGFEGIPSTGEVVFVSINGNRTAALVLLMHDRSSRPTDVEKDESMLWSKYGNFVKCNKSGEVEINGSSDYAVMYTALNAAIQSMVNNFNAALAKKLDGAGAPGTVVVDLSSAKDEKVRL